MIPWLIAGALILALTIAICLASIAIVMVGEEPDDNLEAAIEFYQKNSCTSDILLSYTTMPRRLQTDTFKHSLISFLKQSRKLQEIRINIPFVAKRTNEPYVIPTWLEKLKVVTIIRCEDEGPATKYLPTLKAFQDKPDQRILIYDDDLLMPNDLVETFHKLSNKHCWSSVSNHIPEPKWGCYHGKFHYGLKFAFDLIGKPYKELSPNDAPKRSHCVQGWSGYVLTPAMVDMELLTDYEHMPKNAFFVDDMVMSAALAKKQTHVYVAPGLMHAIHSRPSIMELVLDAMAGKNESLSWTTNLSATNVEVMAAYFSDLWPKLE